MRQEFHFCKINNERYQLADQLTILFISSSVTYPILQSIGLIEIEWAERYAGIVFPILSSKGISYKVSSSRDETIN